MIRLFILGFFAVLVSFVLACGDDITGQDAFVDTDLHLVDLVSPGAGIDTGSDGK